MPSTSEITEAALVEYVRGRLPAGLPGAAEPRITFGRSYSDSHELRVSWTLPNGRQSVVVSAISGQEMASMRGASEVARIILPMADDLVRQIERANRECLSEMATRFGVESDGFGAAIGAANRAFEGINRDSSMSYGQFRLGAYAEMGTPRGGTPWAPFPKKEPKRLSCWEMLMGNALMELV